MKVYYFPDDLPTDIKSVITIGTFDGIHKGHHHILRKVITVAKKEKLESVVLTFSPHPRHVLFPDNQNLFLLDTLEEKIRKLEKIGIENLVVYRFTKEFSRTKSTQFVRDILVEKLNMQHMVVGHDHHFGRNRQGSFDELQELSELYAFGLDQIAAQEANNITVSSTKIRNALSNGCLTQANDLLDHEYMLSGVVIHGDKLGREIGFPTANIKVEDTKLIPKCGVYIVRVYVEEMTLFGMLNIGANTNKIEVHIFDFSKIIYNKEIQVEMLLRLRDEKEIDGLEKLKEQLKEDEYHTKKYLGILT